MEDVGRRALAYEQVPEGCALAQCEILGNVFQSELDLASIDGDSPEIVTTVHPFALVLSQSCDLEWDHSARKESPAKASQTLRSVLLCEVHETTTFAFPEPGTKPWNMLCKNKLERYQFLQALAADENARGIEIPALVVDFKRYFSLAPEEIHARIRTGKTVRIARMKSPYLEQVSTRFAAYLARVALDPEHVPVPRAT